MVTKNHSKEASRC